MLRLKYIQNLTLFSTIETKFLCQEEFSEMEMVSTTIFSIFPNQITLNLEKYQKEID